MKTKSQVIEFIKNSDIDNILDYIEQDEDLDIEVSDLEDIITTDSADMAHEIADGNTSCYYNDNLEYFKTHHESDSYSELAQPTTEIDKLLKIYEYAGHYDDVYVDIAKINKFINN